MKEHKDSERRHDDSYDRDARDERERELEELESPIVPGKRSRTAQIRGFSRQAAVARALRGAGAGEPLDPGVAHEFGPRLDADLGGVRVHTDSTSAEIVRSLGTRAFAFGRHLFFAPGQYAPGTEAGRELIAHELAHVAQQPRAEISDAGDVAVGREGDRYEREADDAAVGIQFGLRAQISRGAPAAARFDGGGGASPEQVLRRHIGSSEEKARKALSNAGSKRGLVISIIRDQFEKETAEEIIKSVKGGGGGEKTPDVPKDAKATAKGKGDAGAEGGKGKGGAKGGAKGKGGGGGEVKGGGKTGQAVDAVMPALGINELSGDQRNLIATELAEHEAWKAAGDRVGAANSGERVMFVLGEIARGGAQGFATGAVMGFAMGAVGQLATRFCPIPGVGAVIAGGMSAYALATRDWGATAETISNFGEGDSKWEVLANSLAAISEVIDIVVQVLNVIAGIIGLVSAIMWLVTIVTVGAASPLAGTLSAIAMGILTVSGVLDNVNNLVLQPAVIAFRAMHAIQSEADPREIVAQGESIAESASKVGAALGGMAGGAAGGAAAKGVTRRAYAPDAPTSAAPEAPSGRVVDDGPAAPSSSAADAPTSSAVDAPTSSAADAPTSSAADAPTSSAADAPTSSVADDAPTSSVADDAPTSSVADDAPTSSAADDAPTSSAADDVQARADQRRAAYAEARAKYRSRSWREKFAAMPENARKVGGEFRAKARQVREEVHQSYRDEAEARQRSQDEIDTQRRQAEEAADAEHRQAVEEGRMRADEAAEAQRTRRRQEADADYDEGVREVHEDGARQRERATRQRDDAIAEADARHRQEHADLDRQQADLEANREQALSDARAIEDPEMRARAEQRAHDDFERGQSYLESRRASADRSRESAVERAHGDHSREQDSITDEIARRIGTRETFKQLDYDRADHRADRMRRDMEQQATRDADSARARAQGEAADTHAERSGSEPDSAAADVRREYRGGSVGSQIRTKMDEDIPRPYTRRGREQLAAQFGKARRQLTGYRGDEGHRALEDPDQVGAGGLGGLVNPVLKSEVEDATKELTGMDKRTEAQKDEDKSAKEQDGFNVELLWTGEKSHQQKAKAARHAAQFAPDARDHKGTRKNPKYADPPGTLEKLDELKGKLQAAVTREAEASAAAKDMAGQEAKHKGNQPGLDGLHGEAKTALDNVKTHKKDVKAKHEANVKQSGEQEKAQQKIGDYAGQSSQFDAVITPMRGVERFLWLGSELGVSYFDDMHGEIKKTLKGFDDMNASMKKQEADAPQQKAELKKKAETIAKTDAQAAKSDSAMKTNEADVAKIKQDNIDTTAKAGEARGQAEGQKTSWAGKAAQYRSEYNSLASGLVSWAQAHKQARAVALGTAKPAVEVTASKPGGAPKPDGAGGGGGGAKPSEAQKKEEAAAGEAKPKGGEAQGKKKKGGDGAKKATGEAAAKAGPAKAGGAQGAKPGGPAKK